MWFIYKIAGNSNNTPSDVFMLLGILFWFSNSKTNIKEENVENFKEAYFLFWLLFYEHFSWKSLDASSLEKTVKHFILKGEFVSFNAQAYQIFMA